MRARIRAIERHITQWAGGIAVEWIDNSRVIVSSLESLRALYISECEGYFVMQDLGGGWCELGRRPKEHRASYSDPSKSGIRR
jgi:hypothetical protein